MKKFDGYLILSDLDGTITASDGSIPKNNINAINYFQENGGRFVLATGRSYEYMNNFSNDFVSSKYIVACNGNVLYNIDEKVVEKSFTLDKKSIDIAVEVADTFGNYLENIQCVGIHKRDVGAIGTYNNICEVCEKLNNELCKFVFVAKTGDKAIEIRDYLRKKYDNQYKIRRTWNEGCEMWSMDAGKEVMINILKEKFKNIHTVIAAGDFENDVEMLKAADISYAPVSGSDIAKKNADIVGVSRDEGLIDMIVNDTERKIR